MTTSRAAALYIGALLGPSVLIVPGLAAAIAGPASIVDWVALLVLSGLLAWVFTALGRRVRDGGGIAAYARAGLGDRAGVAVGWCFLAGVVVGAPVVCQAGAAYLAELFDLGRGASTAFAAALLLAVLGVTLAGARASSAAQLGLVVVLIALVAVAALGGAGHLRMHNWTPFAPHGAASVGPAATVLMLSFVGWEAIAPMTSRLRDPDRQLPRVILIAFVVTSTVYLALAVLTIGVLGSAADGAAPLADLLRVAIGPAGALVAAVVAIALVLTAVNAYLTGAAALAEQLLPHSRPKLLQLAVAVSGMIILAALDAGFVSLTQLVAVPTAFFLTVYLFCTASATRILRGPVRMAAGAACAVTIVILGFSGPALVVVAVVIAAAALIRRRARHGARKVNATGTTSAVADDRPSHPSRSRRSVRAGSTTYRPRSCRQGDRTVVRDRQARANPFPQRGAASLAQRHGIAR
ncbi:MAG TPA: APC family permease, partial [Gaiellales bacterium]|nr:APC family permease [Gaiellales bacterium]